MKKLYCLIALMVCSLASNVLAHEFYYPSDTKERQIAANMPTLSTNLDTIPYSYLLYGFTLHVEINGAELNTTDVNVVRNATTVSTPNVVRPYRVSNNTISYRISGNHDLRVINFMTLSIDQNVLSAPHSLSITLPVFQDIAPPDTPHPDANKTAELTVASVKATDFLDGSGVVFTMTLNEGAFLPGCADPIAHSIMNTSNVQGLVRIWHKTSNRVEFVVQGGYYTPDSGNWNFELAPETTSLNRVLHVSTPIIHE
ncbi:TPA: hypothetical protein ACX6SH_000482 [Photobacterium damselae]